MDESLIVGLLAGLFGFALALVVVIGMPLGLFNRLLLVKPDRLMPPASRDDVLASIMALNDPRRPWEYRLAPEDSRADLIAEWKLADARWWGVFSRNGFKRTYRAFIALNERDNELRIVEQTASVTWGAGFDGAPFVSWHGNFFRGVILFERSREIAYGIKELLPPNIGELYSYDFDPWRVKGPLLRMAVEHGWSYAPVIFKFQLGRKPPAVAVEG